MITIRVEVQVELGLLDFSTFTRFDHFADSPRSLPPPPTVRRLQMEDLEHPCSY